MLVGEVVDAFDDADAVVDDMAVAAADIDDMVVAAVALVGQLADGDTAVAEGVDREE